MMIQPELSRLVEVGKIPLSGLRLAVEASPEERAALAQRFHIPDIKTVHADVELKLQAGGVLMTGRLEALVVQTCVISSVPVEQRIAEELQLRFSPDVEESGEEEVELTEGDLDVLPLEGDAVDVGEAIAETLALALDPYPRAPDIELAQVRKYLMSEEEARLAGSPFAGLAQKRNASDDKG